MRIALIPTLLFVGWIGVFPSQIAVAQYGGAPTATASTATVAGTAANATSVVPSALDNGLWEGANVGPNCAACDNGPNAPAEWYSFQGARVLSRSCTRKVGLSYQSPKNGYYQAGISNETGSTDYVVTNGDVPTAVSVYSSARGTYVPNPYEVVNATQFGLGIAPAYDMTIGHYVCRDRNNNDHFVEFSFWGLSSWSASKVLGGYLVPVYDEAETYTATQATAINDGTMIPKLGDNAVYVGSLRTGFPTAREIDNITDAQKTLNVAFNYGTDEYMSYRSTMNNFELNGRFTKRGQPDRLVLDPSGRWKHECQEGMFMSYLYGLRFMQINEDFNFQTSGLGQWGDNWALEAERAYGYYDVHTFNSLLGLQFGAEMKFTKCRWEWGFQTKMGPYVNFATQRSDCSAWMADGGHEAFDQRLVKSNNGAALIGEVGVHGNYKIRPNLVARAQYDFMWITGVALAPEQLQFVSDPANRINTNGSIYSHGITLGLEWSR